MFKLRALTLGCAVIVLLGCADDGAATNDGSTESTSESTGDGDLCGDEIALPGDMVFPEGITSDAQGRLYVGSAATGELFRVEPCGADGPLVESFVAPGGALQAAGGMRVHADQASLWVCSADFSFTSPAAIIGFDLADGHVIAEHAWPEIGGICNDLAFDGQGNLYATDSLLHRVMRVPAADLQTDTTPEIWSQDPAFVVSMGQFGLNGIVHDTPSNAMLVTIFYPGDDASGSKILRVGIEGDGSAAAAVALDLGGTVVLGADELIGDGQGDYLLIEAIGHGLSRVHVEGDSVTIQLLHDDLDAPSSVAPLGSSAWVVQSQLDHYFGQDPNPPTLPFTLVRRDI